jgi:DNA-binding HxlR family transcriptional regulator
MWLLALALMRYACSSRVAPRLDNILYSLLVRLHRISALLYANHKMFSLFKANKNITMQNCTHKGIDWTISLTGFAENSLTMGKEERKAQVLEMLARSNLALTPYVLFRNLKMNGATFERRTLANYLSELQEEDRVEKLEQPGNALYRITDSGRDSLPEA